MKNVVIGFIVALAKAVFSNPRVRLFCMAYARHAENILFASLGMGVLGIFAFGFLNGESTDPEWLFTLKGATVFFTALIPAVPGIVIMNLKETYDLRTANAK